MTAEDVDRAAIVARSLEAAIFRLVGLVIVASVLFDGAKLR